MHVKKGDKVTVIAGTDKGKSGLILRAMPQENRVVVEGANVRKRHVRGKRGSKGQVVEKPMPIHASNVRKL